ncbi:MAG TPA: enoyl-CoA hydratase/isomerase family protein [Dehalococcoidia bacterium]|nr:enoyl-CoA hydratase/isomerase family protein [Dehalococcoidia bacterium]
MTDDSLIEVEQVERVRVIRLNCPAKLNAFNDELAKQFGDALEAANADPSVGAIVTTGNGRAYSAGNDRAEPLGSTTGDDDLSSAHRAFNHEYIMQLKPIIAAVNGISIGIGLTSSLLYDTIIASTEARFSMRFAAIASVPELGSAWLLPKIIGFHRAQEMVLTGRIYDAEEARDLGLVRRVVEPEQLLPEAIALAQEIAKNPESALRRIKKVMWQELRIGGDEGTWQRSTGYLREARQDAEYREGILSFLEKRDPRYHDEAHMAALRAELDAEGS